MILTQYEESIFVNQENCEMSDIQERVKRFVAKGVEKQSIFNKNCKSLNHLFS